MPLLGLLLRHPGSTYGSEEALSSGEIGGIVPQASGSNATDCGSWIERASRFRGGASVIQLAEHAQSGSQSKIGEGIIAIGLTAGLSASRNIEVSTSRLLVPRFVQIELASKVSKASDVDLQNCANNSVPD
jgi:hypothetical protein